MAAGRSSRFGRNKLLVDFGGKSLISRALDVIPAERLYKIVVVTGYPEVQALAETKGFEVVRNDRPEEGASLTVRFGLERLREAGAALFMVCDQPLLTRKSISAALDHFIKHPDRIVSMAWGGQRGNPCIFPSDFFPELSELVGDVGGSAVIRKHEESLLLFEAASATELMDVDRVSDIEENLRLSVQNV